MTQKFRGTGVALVTPFDAQLQVDFQALEKLLAHITDSQVSYLVVHGTTGEAATTTSTEKQEVLAFIQAHNPKQLPIVLGMGGNNTQAVLQAINSTDWQGVDAVMVASPSYNRPSQEGIYEHYKAIADACPVPVVLYNVPARTGVNIAAATTLRLSIHPNIIGIKEAAGDLVQCMEIARGKADDWLLISGEDILALPMLAIGGAGVISTVANGFPQPMSQMVTLGLQYDFEAAQLHAWSLWPACRLISQAGNPVGTKQLLAALGICQPYVRLPLVAASPALSEEIQLVISQVPKQ
ncbi:MAG: 4-hydroxy-tetrahydrodipicolinate synthase [Bacteroidota bacterium]